MKLLISGPNFKTVTDSINEPTVLKVILEKYKDKFPYPIYAAKVNNAYRSLNHLIHRDSTIEFLDIRDQATWNIYQNSLELLYIKAVKDVCGDNYQVVISNSLNKGLFTTIKPKIEDDVIEKIEKHMKELVIKDLPIIKEHLNKKQALKLSASLKLNETTKLLNSITNIDEVEIYSLDNVTQIFYNLMVPSTSYLKYFELRPYKNGILLRFPHPEDPYNTPKYEDQKLLYSAFSEANRWGKLMQINYVTDLNDRIINNDYKDLFLLQEALHEKRIVEIAHQISERKSRIVLICGPSSSGKTSFAKRLSIQLQINGLKTLTLSTDDYFVEKDEKPIDENGEVDLESIKAVDTKLFVSNLKDLLKGIEVDIPIFDFKNNTKIFGTKITKLEDDQVIVIEGIHSLNQILTEGIDDSQKYKIYISPFTPIAVDQHNRISTTDARMLRRLVRDSQFRNRSAQDVIREWPKVRKSENVNIFPFNSEADVFFNSNCIYELAVLKKYALPLLKSVDRNEPEFAQAQRMLDFLRYIDVIEDDEDIANNSIMREFIGGSVIVK